jgi:hypothetical protein
MKLRIVKRNSQFRSSLAGVCSVLLMLGAGQPGFGQQSTSAAAQTATPRAAPTAGQTAAAERESPSSGKPGNEGIKVHGHWVIDVKNPDGSLAGHRDFENSLADGGQLLVGLLSGYFVAGGYDITLIGDVCPPTGGSNSTGCAIVSAIAGNWTNLCQLGYCYPGLTSTVNLSSSGGPFSMVLAGSFQAPRAAIISSVQTQYNVCYIPFNSGHGFYPNTFSSASPAACNGTSGPAGNDYAVGNFTGTNLTTPIAVTAGQIIQVSVTISFS